MSDFKRGGFGRGEGRKFRRKEGARDRGSEKFSATCNECQKACELPFRPTGDRPVYCSDCFRNKGEGRDNNSRQFDRRNDFRKPSFGGGNSQQNSYIEKKVDDLKRQVESISSKLDQVLSIVSLAKIEKAEVVVEKVPKETKEAKPKKKVVKSKK